MNGPVLLVGDSADDLAALQGALEPLGLEIVTARSGDEALRLILRRDFAIVVMDLAIRSAFEVGALIRERGRCRDLPLVILTSFDEDGAKALPGYRPGVLEFMRKPVPPKGLRSRIVAACVARMQEAR